MKILVGDLIYIAKWWACIFLIGIIFLPTVSTIFSSFFDSGYIFSKTVGIALASYAVWLLSSLKIAPFERLTIIIVLFIAAIIEYGLLKGYKKAASAIKKSWKSFLAEELLFFAGLAFWSYIRGMQPDIYGLEKYMDFGFINSILRSKFLPPVDIWFSGKSINYYYYGHYVAAFLTKLCGIDSAISYNIMLAAVFSFTLSLSFSLGANLFHMIKGKKSRSTIITGIISALLVTLGGNLHTVIYAYVLPAAKRLGLYGGKLDSYFYAEATRYIGYNPPTNDKTIHEFPIYSFVVSDLHGHVSDIPFVLTFLGIMLSYMVKRDKDRDYFLLSALLLGVFYMTNTWDLAIYMTVMLFVFIAKEIIKNGCRLKSIFKAIWDAIKVFLISQALCLPFTLNFRNMTGGVGFASHRTPLYQLLVLWGYQLLLSAVFIIFLIFNRRNNDYDYKADGDVRLEGIGNISAIDIYIIVLIVSAIGLIMIPEIVYVRDIYGATYQRANTMFKLTYQSFIMFGICSGYIIVRVADGIKNKAGRMAISILFAIIIVMPMLYPYYAVKGYYGSIKPSEYKGLYGLNFLNRMYPDDYKVVQWFNKNVKGQSVILEASGDSYTDYERISMATGLPTVEGWFGHEWLWRSGPDAPSARADDVKQMYESKDAELTKLLLQKYNVSYVVIGKLEKQKYPKLDSNKFLKLGKVVFQSNETVVIKAND